MSHSGQIDGHVAPSAPARAGGYEARGCDVLETDAPADRVEVAGDEVDRPSRLPCLVQEPRNGAQPRRAIEQRVTFAIDDEHAHVPARRGDRDLHHAAGRDRHLALIVTGHGARTTRRNRYGERVAFSDTAYDHAGPSV